MSAQSVAASERAALCVLLDERGPDAPTLCDGWTTADLAAHLFVRERRPLAAPGIIFSPLASATAKAMDKALKHYGYEGLVARVRSGPPLFFKPLDNSINTLEYFIHHEDVRRASGDSEPRDDAALDQAVWWGLNRGARLLSRGVKGAGLELVDPSGARIVARQGTPTAVVTGRPQELALFMYGRGSVARVAVDGPEEAKAALASAKLRV